MKKENSVLRLISYFFSVLSLILFSVNVDAVLMKYQERRSYFYLEELVGLILLIVVALYLVSQKNTVKGTLLLGVFLSLFSLNKILNLLYEPLLVGPGLLLVLSISFAVTGAVFITVFQWLPAKLSSGDLRRYFGDNILSKFLIFFLQPFRLLLVMNMVTYALLYTGVVKGDNRTAEFILQVIVFIITALYFLAGYKKAEGVIKEKFTLIFKALLLYIFLTLVLLGMSLSGIGENHSAVIIFEALTRLLLLGVWVKLLFF